MPSPPATDTLSLTASFATFSFIARVALAALLSSLFCLCVTTTECSSSSESGGERDDFFRVIDTHVHNSDVTNIAYTYTASFPDLASAGRNWTMDDFAHAVFNLSFPRTVSAAVRVGVIIMELVKVNSTPETSLKEARLFQGIAERCPPGSQQAIRNECVPVFGFVADAQFELGATATAAYIETLKAETPMVRGIRQAIWTKQSTFWLNDTFVEGVRAIAPFGLPFDVLVELGQLHDLFALVERVPEVKFNLNHLGYPDIYNDSNFDRWASSVAALAELPNVYCKLSGMPQAFAHTGWTAEDFAPYVAHVLDVFGVDRVNFAGNWFVLDEQRWNAAAPETQYQRMFATIAEVLTELLGLGQSDLDRIYSGTATELYRL